MVQEDSLHHMDLFDNEVEMFEMIYVTKEDFKSVQFSLMYVFLPPKNTFPCP